MRWRRILIIAGVWGLGILTGWAIQPEREMYVSMGASIDRQVLNDYAGKGWVVSASAVERYYVLERPRLRLP